MAIAACSLLLHEKPLWHHQVKVILSACHRHVKKTALFFQLLAAAERKVGWDAAVDGVENVNRFPFLALGGMDGRAARSCDVRRPFGLGYLGRPNRDTATTFPTTPCVKGCSCFVAKGCDAISRANSLSGTAGLKK